MDSKVINMDYLISMLEENGVTFSIVDGKIKTVSVNDPDTNFSYTICNGELKSFHLQDEKVEINFEETTEETTLKVVRGQSMHTASFVQ